MEQWSFRSTHECMCACVCIKRTAVKALAQVRKSTCTEWGHVFACMHVCRERVIWVESDMGWEWHGLRVTWVYPYMGESPPVGWREVDFHIRSKELFLLLGSKLESRLLNNTQVLVYMVRSLRTPCEVEQGGTEEKAWIWGPETWIQMSPLDPSLCGLGNFPSPLYHFPHL